MPPPPTGRMQVKAGKEVWLIGPPSGQFAKCHYLTESMGGPPTRSFTHSAILQKDHWFLYNGECVKKRKGVWTALVKLSILSVPSPKKKDC